MTLRLRRHSIREAVPVGKMEQRSLCALVDIAIERYNVKPQKCQSGSADKQLINNELAETLRNR